MSKTQETAVSTGAAAFANRLRKNRKRLARWLRQESIHAYRLYDADMPEYALAVDVYEGERRWVQVQEYEAPRHIDPQKAHRRLQEGLVALREVLEVDADQLFLKVRRPQRGHNQYQKLGARGRFHEIVEGGNRFLVNFEDYLDTGLFLDHRITRRMLGELAPGLDFLNLFAYTGTASVYAAAGGAASTTSVDLSATYLDWARRNLELNGFAAGPRHRLIQADCLTWLRRQANGKRRYGLIFLDPPSFSTSKRMRGTFDVQRDQVPLLEATVRLLAPGGILIFSNNRRRFRLDREALGHLKLEEISRLTLPRDFQRNPRIHNCWRIQAPYDLSTESA